MELTAGRIAITIVVVGIMTWGLKLLNWVWLKPKRLEKLLRKQGFNGNSYRVLFGDMKEFMTMMEQTKSKSIPLSNDIMPHALSYYHYINTKYGKNSFIWFGPKPRLNITDPELIKEILSKPNIFQKTHPDALRDLIIGGLLVSEGEKWAKIRNIVSPAFHHEKLKNMIPTIYSSCSEMIKKWEMLIPTSGSIEVDVWPYLNNLTGDVISRTAFGINHKEGEKIFQLQKEQVKIVLELWYLLYIPGWRFLPIKGIKIYKEICSELQVVLRGIIKEREKAIEMGEANSDDLLGTLLESNSKEIKEHGNGLSMDDVIEECKLFYLAGSDTTSSLLVWTMILLSKHQDWQKNARNEVMQVFGNRELDFNGINHLKIVTMILNEVLRLYPPVVLVTRAICEETKLGNIILPTGVELTLPTLQIHHDRKIWGKDATEFKPERFSEGVSNATKGKGSYSFLPFIGGPRVCLGQNFAMIEAKMAIATILQRFSFELSPSYKHSPFPIITLLPPQFGAHLLLHRM